MNSSAFATTSIQQDHTIVTLPQHQHHTSSAIATAAASTNLLHHQTPATTASISYLHQQQPIHSTIQQQQPPHHAIYDSTTIHNGQDHLLIQGNTDIVVYRNIDAMQCQPGVHLVPHRFIPIQPQRQRQTSATSFEQHLQQQQPHFTHQQQHLSTLLPQHSAQLTQHYAQQHFATQVAQTPPTELQSPIQLHQLPTTATAQYYVPTDSTATVTTATTSVNVLPPTLTALSATPTLIGSTVPQATATLPPPSTQQITTPALANSTTSSTVVLDRINICINNHYNDATSSSANGVGAIRPPSTLANSSAQPTSPIIPAIQHKPGIVDSVISGLFIDPFGSSNDSTLIIDEPDSTTTTPQTPPTTSEDSSPAKIIQSTPTSTSVVVATATTAPLAVASEQDISIMDKICVIELEEVAQLQLQSPPQPPPPPQQQQLQQQQQEVTAAAESVPLLSLPLSTALTSVTPPTPPPPPPPPTIPTINYSIGEDVFIKRLDCFYLGTIINNVRQQYLIRFDDKSQLWCPTDIMRKMGGDSGDCEQSSDQGQMCVACKRSKQNDVVEICERCGRGYHRNCTTETSPGSGVWLCKRCAKPMKMLIKSAVCRQLPYHVDTLKWDEKHRVNEEQIYCYCGKTGKFDHNMLQCCKCKNWFHTDCMQCFTSKILRGDGFFVFCCSVCNDGEEFLRRLQMNWVDVMHLTLYNLSAMKKHQHHKYHHLLQDIWPFILEKRRVLPIPRKWIEMSETEFKEKITKTLKENADRFICGREAKRGHYYYALRNNGPPILPKINVHADDLLCDELLVESLKLTLWKDKQHDNEFNKSAADNFFNFREVALKLKAKENLVSKSKSDVYEFRIEDDEKFTSDDEIPIKHIIDKAKKIKTSPITSDNCRISSSKNINNISIRKHAITAIDDVKLVLDDENANDAAKLNLLAIKKSRSSSPHEQTVEQITPKKTISTVDNNNQQQQKVESSKSEIKTSQISAAATATSSVTTAIEQKSSRKRKAFTLSKSYKEIASEAAAKRYDCSRICDSSSDENSSSSRGTSLDVIIPAPKNFLGSNNPFRMVTPKKNANVEQPNIKKTVSFGRNCGGGTVIKNSIFNTSALDFSSKLAALKSAGIFPNLSTSDLAKAAGQPRTVRTIKRRLSAKDITIGPNQEVRRRRTRRLSSNVEVISTTTINPIPNNFFPIHAKDLLTSTHTITNHQHKLNFHKSTINHQMPTGTTITQLTTSSSLSSSASSSPPASTTSSIDAVIPTTATELHTVKLVAAAAAATIPTKPTHGRRLRVRPQKTSPGNSRRSSISGASTSSNASSNGVVVAGAPTTTATAPTTETTMQDLKQSVNKYFGAVNRIESGEQFSIRAKRQLANGQWQYLIEWGDATMTATVAAPNNKASNSASINATTSTPA